MGFAYCCEKKYDEVHLTESLRKFDKCKRRLCHGLRVCAYEDDSDQWATTATATAVQMEEQNAYSSTVSQTSALSTWTGKRYCKSYIMKTFDFEMRMHDVSCVQGARKISHLRLGVMAGICSLDLWCDHVQQNGHSTIWNASIYSKILRRDNFTQGTLITYSLTEGRISAIGTSTATDTANSDDFIAADGEWKSALKNFI